MQDSFIASAEPEKRILVVNQPYPEMIRLLRMAKFQAARRGCAWELLHVDTPVPPSLASHEDQAELLYAQTMARQMGAIVTVLQAPGLMDGIDSVLQERRKQGIVVDLILVTEEKGPGLLRFWGRQQLASRLQHRYGKQYAILPFARVSEQSMRRRLNHALRLNLKHIAYSLLLVGAATMAVELLAWLWPSAIDSDNRNKPVIFMTACALAAGRFGMLPGLVAAVAGFIVQALLYYMPQGSLRISDPAAISNGILFLIASAVIALFGSNAHLLRLEAWAHAERYKSLLRIHKAVFDQHEVNDAFRVLDKELSDLLKLEIAFFVPDNDNPARLTPMFRDRLELSATDERALAQSWQENKATGVAAAIAPTECCWRFEPLSTPHNNIGVLGIKLGRTSSLDVNTAQLFASIADQTALIIERLQLEYAAEEKRVQAEREQLRAMLLSSVSHDLKTPLASVIGSLSVIRSMDDRLNPEQRQMLMNNALDEAQRLDSFITNILDMTRLESGQIEFKKDWVKPAELISDVARRLRERLRNHRLKIGAAPPDVMVNVDGMMVSQVLQNLLDNAVKYTAPGTEIEIECFIDAGLYKVEVRDQGLGIPETHLGKIFDKYARIKRQDMQVAGTGLGLAIARAIMRSQGGDVLAANRVEGGAVFTLILPEWRTVAALPLEAAHA